jgi:hypothetical protein
MTNKPGTFENPVTAVLHTKRDSLAGYLPAEQYKFLELLQITPNHIRGRTFKNVIITKDCDHEMKKFGEEIYNTIRNSLSSCVATCCGQVTVEN